MPTSENHFSPRLAEWIAQAPQHARPEVLEQARLSFLDTLGCMVAGATSDPVRSVVAASTEWGKGEVPVAGTSSRLALPWAALANGTAAHALDFDDNLEPALGHASAVLVPAILSVASTRRSPGAAVLDAYVVGIEVMGRLGAAFNMDHYSKGWHATLTLGAPAAAAAIARLVRLDAGQTRNALSIATSMAGGSKIQFGTGLKPVHAGLAAKAGITAALFAAAGLDAAPEALAGNWGLHGLMNGAPGGCEVLAADIGQPLMIERFGLMRKIYPSCAAMHRAIDGILDMRMAENLKPDEILGLRVAMAEIQTQNLRFPRPSSVSEARFSLEYCAASTLVDGELGLSAFTEGAIARPAILALAQRITMVTDPALHGQLQSDAQTPTTLELSLTDGRTLRHVVPYQRGHEARPLTYEEVEAKFASLVEPVLGGERASRLRALLAGLPALVDSSLLLEAAVP
ncbi:MmgE/PrpD family protein [Boseaceae bacterium BT-24-1]|nr:MmgE/PrpD family protein [Boseaceae bacterium BT-24-1]